MNVTVNRFLAIARANACSNRQFVSGSATADLQQSLASQIL
jgi:hypothetical protein